MTDDIEARASAWWHRPDLRVRFEPQAVSADPGELLVGIGREARGGVMLNHKAGASILRSVSEFVMKADAQVRAGWHSALPHGMSGVRSVVLEDLSLDTCFSLLCFGRLLASPAPGDRVPASSRDIAWCDYVSRWELGFFTDPALLQSVAALHALLVHSFDLDMSAQMSGTEAEVAQRLAFVTALDFLDTCWRLHDDPATARVDAATPGWTRAAAQCETERQAFEQVLVRSEILQLQVPLASTGRRVLVDALLVEETAPSGILKLFARTDREHGWTRRGFPVLLFHRPNERGTGNDLTASVDPSSGLSLKDLWVELEARENAAWQGQRATGSPRNLVSYRRPDGAGMQPGAPDEPWYDDQGRYTLVAAPKGDGSRLGWRDLREAAWHCYRPIPAQCRVVEARPLGQHRRFVVVRWRHDATPTPTARNPSFERWLAALSQPANETRDAAELPLSGLPAAADVDVLPLPGGLLLAHPGGVTLFDDWSSAPLDVDYWQGTLTTLAEMSDESGELLSGGFLSEGLGTTQALSAEGLHALIKRESAWEESFEEFDGRTIALLARRLEVDRSAGRAAAVAVIEKLWGLSAERDQLIEVSERVQRRAQRGFDRLKARRGRLFNALIAGAGLGLLAKELFEPIRSVLGMGAYEWQYKLMSHAPEAVLEQEIRHAEHLEIATVGVVLAFMVAGALSYLRWDASAREG